jgi:hypothetical protein
MTNMQYLSNFTRKIKNQSRYLIPLSLVATIALTASCANIHHSSKFPTGYEISSGWTVTSYQTLDEKLYSGNKTEVFDSNGKSLGFYKNDFLEQVKIDGAGKGDGIQNSGKFLQYNYDLDDGETYYLSNRPLAAYGNTPVPWTGDKPSVAVNPAVPHGTEITFIDLGPDGNYSPDWVIELLKNKTFYADDRFHNMGGKRIDVYVGFQRSRDLSEPESLLMGNVTISMKYPK